MSKLTRGNARAAFAASGRRADLAKETDKVRVLWIGPGHCAAICVDVPAEWLQSYRSRIRTEWKGTILAVYRPKSPTGRAALSQENDHE